MFHAIRPRLTVDVTPLLESYWTGIPVFTRRLVRSLHLHGGLDLEFMFQLTKLPTKAVLAAIDAGSGIFLRALFEREASSSMAAADSSTRFLYPSVKECPGVSTCEASTVHDVSALLMPEMHSASNVAYHLDYLTRQLSTDDITFCISEATRAALLSAFPSVRGKTRILSQYVDWPERFALLERNLTPMRFRPYAITVGTVEPRKNLRVLLRALSLAEVRRLDLDFIVIGRNDMTEEDWRDADLGPDVRDRVHVLGFVSEFTKYRLIKGARFLIFPSLYEGFGIPALEAMSLGKPILASWSSSLPEVIGDAGIYFDPFSAREFAAALATIAHPSKLAELGPIARANAAAFTWQRMAEPVIAWAQG